jgi:hypothetical protein
VQLNKALVDNARPRAGLSSRLSPVEGWEAIHLLFHTREDAILEATEGWIVRERGVLSVGCSRESGCVDRAARCETERPERLEATPRRLGGLCSSALGSLDGWVGRIRRMEMYPIVSSNRMSERTSAVPSNQICSRLSAAFFGGARNVCPFRNLLEWRRSLTSYQHSTLTMTLPKATPAARHSAAGVAAVWASGRNP